VRKTMAAFVSDQVVTIEGLSPMAHGKTTTCKACGDPIEQVSGGHRQRLYCTDTCRQAAFRSRQLAARRRRCVEEIRTWGSFQPATVDYLADWLLVGNEKGARHLAALIASEQGQAPAQSSDASEKLMLAGQRVAKLEKQVEIQQQRLRQYYARFYPLPLAAAEEKLLALGAAVNYRRLLKYNELTVDIGAGSEAWREFATHADVDTLALAIVQAQRFHDNLQAIRTASNRDNQADNN
jgi:hypothetical protein